MLENPKCKICKSSDLKIIYHVAICKNCKVLLFYPYPENDKEIFLKKKYTKDNIAINDNIEETKKRQLDYLLKSGHLNIKNFKQMINFTIPESLKDKQFDVLDYGGGGGQFASICNSIFPLSKIYITDLYDEKLIEKYKPFNNQIKFSDFENNKIKFDFIFLNDVFEHLSDPSDILELLKNKLKDKNSKIFIDTPKKFWLYEFSSIFSKKLYRKILNGTVDQDHQQIWSKKSFYIVVRNSNLTVDKYKELTEFTQPASFYLDAMKIKNFYLRLLGKFFYILAPIIARNKIISILKRS